MSDLLSLAALSATALTEGVRFLYDQAGELLRARREHRAERSPVDTPPVVAEPAVLPEPDAASVERFSEELRALRADLHEFASGVDETDPSNPSLIRRVDALRTVLEAVYGTSLTFDGESRRDGPLRIHGRVDVDAVAGYVAAVRTDSPTGWIRGDLRAGSVEAGGEAIGIDLRNQR
ncbi:polymer-forming cytoskeletal protein [Streptomyces sp. Root369]|uniref:polymer-forming cytoskeletal protein n=1 Tax=Streptomyces sp. Root369 TaxID=1736523 RepID=UPI000709E591|nr:polymer-forming cytoskeletal protein [Streptomyces sp. Root369]KQW03322.1 hypothetical protein ASD08_44285 [Streptomyces sp. Root369]